MNGACMITDNLRKIRMDNGLSLKQLAEVLREKDHKVRDVEMGKQRADSDYLKKVSTQLKVNLNWLICDEGPIYKNDKLECQNDQEIGVLLSAQEQELFKALSANPALWKIIHCLVRAKAGDKNAINDARTLIDGMEIMMD